MVWSLGHGQKNNDQLLCELPRTKVGGDIEYYTIIAEWQPPSNTITQKRVQEMEDLHYRMAPAYLLVGSFLGEWLNGRDIPSLIDEPHRNRGGRNRIHLIADLLKYVAEKDPPWADTLMLQHIVIECESTNLLIV